jgi:hypothetical protein
LVKKNVGQIGLSRQTEQDILGQYGMQDTITLPELEAAINFWRQRSPSVGEELRLCAQASSLATPYALMIIQRRAQMLVTEMPEKAQAALTEWLAQR